MTRALVDFCLRERLLVSLLVLVLLLAGWFSTQQVPIDAIPNIDENQVIVFTAWPGRSPKDVEDQVTYPLSVSLLAVPGAKSVRGKSLFGYSFVQVTFNDNVDFYWARSRVVEQLTSAASQLPDGVAPSLGPDATALGQVLYYILEPDPEKGTNLADLRSLQDFVVKFELQAVEGVSEVASVGGHVRQYQIEVNPDQLRFHNIPLDRLMQAVRDSNLDVGAKTVESSGMEFILRGRGFLGEVGNPQLTVRDIEQTVVATREGVPIRIKDLGEVQIGPAFRRGALDYNGSEAVGGVVVMRHGENPRSVIQRVRERMQEIERSLDGAKFRIVYNRTDLIEETVTTLTTALREEVLITVVVILIFLLHLRASFVVAATLPLAVLMAFIAMYLFGLDANIMSLAGIAIAIGTMVDLGIVISENIYRHLADWEAQGSPGDKKQRLTVIREAVVEVAPAVMTAVTTTVVSFLPVFFLTGRDHKLFAPLAWTKTFALVASLIVALVFVPLLARGLLQSGTRSLRCSVKSVGLTSLLFTFGYWLCLQILLALNSHPNLSLKEYPAWRNLIAGAFWPIQQFGWTPALFGLFGILIVLGFWMSRERLQPLEKNPISRLIAWVYAPTLRFFLGRKLLFFCLPLSLIFLGVGAYWGLPVVLKPVENAAQKVGTDLNQVPGYVTTKHALPGLKSDDWIALDEGSWFYMPTLYPAASFSQAMQILQTQDAMIREIPEVRDVLGKIGRVESALDPAPAAMIETYVMLKPESEWKAGRTAQDIWEDINNVATLPGVTPASALQPIQGRVIMLQSGIKASMAIRIFGDDLEGLNKAAMNVAGHLKTLPEVNANSVNPDIVLGKPYIEFEVNREEAARYGMTVRMVNQIVEAALGGMNITHTLEGRERYPIQIRYQRGLREKIEELERIPVVTHTGEVVPLSNLSDMQMVWGPGQINSEDARLVAHVSFSPSGSLGDLETVRAVERSLAESQSKLAGDPGRLDLPRGYSLQAVGSFQNQVEANWRLLFIVPSVILINVILVYLQFRNLPITFAVFAGIPVAFAGGMILLGIYQVEMNTAIWVGFIALFGIAMDDGVIMATYLHQIFLKRKLDSVADIRQAVADAGLKRIRPCLMTTFTTLAALVPVLIATGRGSDIARAMALPVFGGMLVELITLFVVPVLFSLIMEFKMKSGLSDDYWEPQANPQLPKTTNYGAAGGGGGGGGTC